MESFFQKARLLAQETAKKSHELLTEGAKISQEFAKETVKQTEVLAKQTQAFAQVTVAQTQTFTQTLDTAKIRDFASETAKKAEIGIKAIVRELNPTNGINADNEKELEEYGITPDLQEFVKGLTIRTFKDFPINEVEILKTKEEEEEEIESNDMNKSVVFSNVINNLDPWQERHALLVLSTVPEISDFRYVLCPKRMSEEKFWKVYFILVDSHLKRYRIKAAEKAKDEKSNSEIDKIATESITTDQSQSQSEKDSIAIASSVNPAAPAAAVSTTVPAAPAASASASASSATSDSAPLGAPEKTDSTTASKDENDKSESDKIKSEKNKILDNDLDDYLLGGSDGDDDLDDEDFEKLVNSVDADSDSDEKK